MSQWYTKKSPNGTYYTPFSVSKASYTHAGPGDRMPTPEELVRFLKENSIPGKDLYVDSSGYISVYDSDEGKSEKCSLPGGVYLHKKESSDTPERLVPMTIRSESYVDLGGLSREIKTDIDDFLANETIYREDGQIYKLGVLVYGPPGNGKTALLRDLMHHTFPEGTVVIYLYGLPTVEFIQKIQESLGDRLKVFVFEEMVTVVEVMPIHIVLNFLDGEHSVDRSITFATTNHPEKLPANLVDRPSRFDKRYKLGNPKSEERRKLLAFYLKRSVTDEDVTLTKNMSVAGLKEISMLIRIKKMELKAAVKHLADFSELVKKDFGEFRKIGITRWDEE